MTSRTTRRMTSRWVLAGLALLVALALALTGAFTGPAIGITLGLEVGAVGLVLLGLALWRWPGALAAGIVLIAVPWGLALSERPRPVEAVAVGAGLVLLAELAGWSIDRVTVVPETSADVGHMVLRTTGLVVAGAAISVVVLAFSALPAPGSLLRLTAGLCAVVAVMGFVTLRRWER